MYEPYLGKPSVNSRFRIVVVIAFGSRQLRMTSVNRGAEF